ncbi:MAG: phospholipase D-like domain-containing protein [Gammaproteobacteria bacterium]|nr:phospholipase D-like domain-containing protein [Gammaproteobacteria bacterium]
MDHRGAESAGTLALFPPDGRWARTRVLDAQALEAADFDLDAFARYRRIRILTYSSSVQMLNTVLERFAESHVECVLGYSRVVNDMASIIALQTVAMEDVHGAYRNLSESSRDAVLDRVREGRLQVRVVEGHVSHAKIFLLSDGPGGDRCVLTGSANFSTPALLGDQHEVLIRFRDECAWEHFEREYLNVRDHASAEVPIAELVEQRLEPSGGLSPDAVPVFAPGRGAQVIQLARAAESGDSVERGRRVEKLHDVVLPLLPKEAQRSPSGTVKLDDTARKRFSGLIRRQTRRLEPAHPTFSLDLVSHKASVSGLPWSLESEEEKVREDAAALAAFWGAYRSAFRGRIEKLQRDYFIFLCWMFFSPFICTLRRQAALEGRDVIRFPRVGIVYGKSNSGKTQLVEIVGRSMFGQHFQGAIRTPLTGQHLRGIDASYCRMPAFFDDITGRRFREHASEFIKDETLSPHEESPCTVVSMNAKVGSFPDEIAKRCLLIYSAASLPSDDESSRIAMSNRLSAVEPTTHLYRRYVREVLERLPSDPRESDWLLLSSQILFELLAGCGHDAEWAEPLAWETYAATRYDALREQLRSLLDATRRRSSRPPLDTEGWYAEGARVWVRVGTNSFGRPDFEWRDLPTYMLHEHESRAAEFVLDLRAVESFLGQKLAAPRWRFALWPRPVR